MQYKHTLYACYLGYITQAVVNNLAPLLFLIFQDEFSISLSRITLLVTVNFLVQLLVDFLSAAIADRVGYRTLAVAAHLLCTVGLCSMAILPIIFPSPFAALLLSVCICAVGGGLIEVLISPIVEACPTDDKSSAMSLLHSFYCWGCVFVALFSTLFLALFGKSSWHILALIWALLPLCNSVFFSRVPIAALTEKGEGLNIKSLFSLSSFRVLFVLMFAAGACEQAMSQWASAFCESALGISKTVGDVFGVCLFSLCMGTARLLNAKIGNRYNISSLLTLSAVLCAFSYLLTALAPQSALSLVGCALTGFSVGVLWPGVFSLASQALPKGGTAMFALLALAGDLGCSAGPTLVGFVSAQFNDSLKIGLITAVIFPAVLFVFTRLQRKCKM